jgi:apolipoprotein N-acyltransferase
MMMMTIFFSVLFILARRNTQIFYWLLYCPSAGVGYSSHTHRSQTSKMAPASFHSFYFLFSSGSNWIELLLHNNREKSSSFLGRKKNEFNRLFFFV